MRNLNETEMSPVAGGDNGDPGAPPPSINRGPSIQDLIDAWNVAHPAHPIA